MIECQRSISKKLMIYIVMEEWSQECATRKDGRCHLGITPGIKLKKNPPIKDTIVVPSVGYIVIRFKASNPGAWFLHSQVDLHTTNGMAMIFQVGPVSKFTMADNPHACLVQKDTDGDNRPISNSPSFGKQPIVIFYAL